MQRSSAQRLKNGGAGADPRSWRVVGVCVFLALSVGSTCAASDCVDSVTLSQYQWTATYALPANLVSEASAVTFNWDTGTLFVVGDGGPAVIEVTRAGVLVSTMTMSNFQDTEGLTYIGGGKFVIAEERNGRGYLFTYVAGGALNRNTLQSASIGPNTGTNSGSEGVAFDPLMGKYFAVKEKDPLNVFQVTPNFAAGTSSYSDLFNVASLTSTDLSDLHALATVADLQGTADQDNLLILSQQSAKLMKVTRAGVVLGTRSVSTMSTTMEGITIDDRGVIFMCDDSTTPKLYVLTPGRVDACPCPPDFDSNGVVDGADLGSLLASWGAAPPGTAADFDASGQVDGADLGVLLASWGACQPANAAP